MKRKECEDVYRRLSLFDYRTRLDDEARLDVRFFRCPPPFDDSVTFVELANRS